jgi:hypothetical protein
VKCIGLLFILLISFTSYLPAEVSPQLVDKLTLTVCQFLEGNGCRTVPPNPRHRSKIFLTTKFLRGVVQDCMEAADFNPSAGSPIRAGIKLISSVFGESGFDPDAVRIEKDNPGGGIDRGILQINSIHMGAPWDNFCINMGVKPNPNLIWNPRMNIFFAALINESLARCHCKTYRYNHPKRKDQKRLYVLLQEAIK